MTEKCPNCDEENFVPKRVVHEVKYYGDEVYRRHYFKCTHCKTDLVAFLSKIIDINIQDVYENH